MEHKGLQYRIEYEVDKETKQVVATIPELNHASSFGASFAEAEANVREAAMGYLEVLLRNHRRIPKPAFKTEGTYLKIFAPTSTPVV